MPRPEPKPDPSKRLARSRSEEELRRAIRGESNIAPHYDEPEHILTDAVNELLRLRLLKADVLAFITDQQGKLTRR